MYDIEHIRDVYENTWDKYFAVRELAREYKVKPADIFKVLKDNGIIGKGEKFKPHKFETEKTNRYTEEEIETLLSMKAEGKTFTEIEKVLGRSAKTLSAKYQKLKNDAEKEKTPKPKKEQPVEETEPVVASEQHRRIQLESIPEGYTLKAKITVWFPYLDAVEEFLNESEFAKSGGLDQVQIEEKRRIIFKKAEEDA